MKESRHGWVTIEDAAEHLAVDPRTVRRMISAGRIPAYRMGPRLVRIKAADVESVLARIPTRQ